MKHSYWRLLIHQHISYRIKLITVFLCKGCIAMNNSCITLCFFCFHFFKFFEIAFIYYSHFVYPNIGAFDFEVWYCFLARNCSFWIYNFKNKGSSCAEHTNIYIFSARGVQKYFVVCWNKRWRQDFWNFVLDWCNNFSRTIFRGPWSLTYKPTLLYISSSNKNILEKTLNAQKFT